MKVKVTPFESSFQEDQEMYKYTRTRPNAIIHKYRPISFMTVQISKNVSRLYYNIKRILIVYAYIYI